ncbi:MAG: hypothetical protein JXR94_10525 [Candidatus Hydrogenedentes bacterium]|nr:hypothetical protein [Candidatus Hydrogenedentota bacterium]
MRTRMGTMIRRATWPCALAMLLLPAASGAAPAVRGNWADGACSVAGEGWTAGFQRGAEGIVLESGGVRVTVAPFGQGSAPPLEACAVTREGDAAVAHARFGHDDGSRLMTLRFDEAGLVALTPGPGAAGAELACDVAVGVLPGHRLDDVLFFADEFDGVGEVHIPSENWFAALIGEGDGLLACGWEGEGAGISLRRDDAASAFRAIRLAPKTGPLYLQLLAAPGLWHCEELQLDYLEKDVKLDWHRPVPAAYRTQLTLRGQTAARRTYAVGSVRHERWAPEVGFYVWPAWFDGDQACLHLGKRIPPKGRAVFYPFVGADASMWGALEKTPVAAMVAARAAARAVPRESARPPTVGYIVCWGTFLLRRTIYAAGAQCREKAFLDEHNAFLTEAVVEVQRRHVEYARFIETMRGRIQAWIDEAEDGAVRGYLESMLAHVEDLDEQHRREMVAFGGKTPEDHIARARANQERLAELCGTPGTEVFPECYELIDQLNRLSAGHNEQTGMRFGLLNRAWAHDAAVEAADLPGAVPYAQDIRAAIRDALNLAQW